MCEIRRLILSVLVCGLLTGMAQAADAVGMGQWVNFCPAEWNRAETVCTLSQMLEEAAGERRDIPRAVHDWVCENLYFDEDVFRAGTYAELAADETLRSRKGVCEPFANLVQSLLLETGIPCIKVWGCAIPEGTSWEEAEIDPERVNHTWNAFYMDGRWIMMDCMMDMGNRYTDGEYLTAAWEDSFFDPDVRLFEQTHRVLQRGFDLPAEIPDVWAMPEIEEAAVMALFRAEEFRNYREPVTGKKFCALLGTDGGTDAYLTRSEAAVLLAGRLRENGDAADSYHDLEGCSETERRAIAALEQAHIIEGTGRAAFSPNAFLTKQEAIALAVRIHKEGF